MTYSKVVQLRFQSFHYCYIRVTMEAMVPRTRAHDHYPTFLTQEAHPLYQLQEKNKVASLVFWKVDFATGKRLLIRVVNKMKGMKSNARMACESTEIYATGKLQYDRATVMKVMKNPNILWIQRFWHLFIETKIYVCISFSLRNLLISVLLMYF